MHFRQLVCCWLLFVFPALSQCFAALRAEQLQLEVVNLPPPDGFSADICKTLEPRKFEISGEGSILIRFWLRKSLPLGTANSGQFGVSFGEIGQSTLVGVASIPGKWIDYKSRTVGEGLYTLRYGLQPMDGNHMGVTMYRDFLLLIPASTDHSPDQLYTSKQLVDLSKQASESNHPVVLGLFPMSGEMLYPRLSKNERDQWVLQVKVGTLNLGMVVVGQGEF